jgi:hypothetical protein
MRYNKRLKTSNMSIALYNQSFWFSAVKIRLEVVYYSNTDPSKSKAKQDKARQCSAVQCSAVQCSAVQYNIMQYNRIDQDDS